MEYTEDADHRELLLHSAYDSDTVDVYKRQAHERGESGLMQRPAHGDGSDVRALLGQRGGREQTIATIVSGPGQQHDRRVLQRQILVVQHTGRHVGRGLGGHAHQRHAFVQQGSLHGPDLSLIHI